MRISDGSSDVCSSDLQSPARIGCSRAVARPSAREAGRTSARAIMSDRFAPLYNEINKAIADYLALYDRPATELLSEVDKLGESRPVGHAMRLASYNVENLFARPVAMNQESWAQGRPALEDHAELNRLFGKRSEEQPSELQS